MKKIALMVILAMVASAPAIAAPKKSKKPRAETMQKIDPNEASWRLVVGSLPIWLPSWSMPMYMAVTKEAEAQKMAAAKPAKRRMARKPAQ